MEDRIQEIIDSSLERLIRYEQRVKELESIMDYCALHKFDEEVRVARSKWDELNMVVYNWRIMVNDLQDMLNKWKS